MANVWRHAGKTRSFAMINVTPPGGRRLLDLTRRACGVSVYVVGAEHQHDPADRAKLVPTPVVRAPLFPMQRPVVLHRHAQLWVCEIEASNETAVRAPNLELAHRDRQAMPDQEQAKPRFHRRLGARICERRDVAHLPHSSHPRPIRGQSGEVRHINQPLMRKSVDGDKTVFET
jgi:hypothetical protein